MPPISGFPIVRNALKLDFPVEASIRSILPVCDEVVVMYLGRVVEQGAVDDVLREDRATAAALDVYTTRSTPARRHSCMSSFVPPTLTSKTRSESAGRTEVTPPQWKTRSTPPRARRSERRSRSSRRTRSASRSAIASSGESRSTPSRSSSPRSPSRCAT